MLVLVDANNIFMRAFFSRGSLSRSDGHPVGALYGSAMMLWDHFRWHQPSHAVFAHERRSGLKRIAAYPQYKAQRSAERPAELTKQYGPYRDLCSCFGLNVEIDGAEADDVIASYARHASNNGSDVQIVSNDKDLLALVRPGVEVVSREKKGDRFVNKVFREASDVVEVWGVEPWQVSTLLALAGDSADNIPGVPGIGVGRAAKLLRDYGDIDGILRNADRIHPPSVREAIRQHGAKARETHETLTRLDWTLAVPPMPKVPADWRERLHAYATEWEFPSLLRQIEEAANLTEST